MENLRAPQTSEQQMNMFRLQDKMNVLNSEFMKVIKHYHDEKAHYDFSNTMQSYIDHVKSLKVMYKVDDTDENSVPTSIINKTKKPSPEKAPTHRKLLKAARKNTPATKTPTGTLSSTFVSSSPVVIPPTPNFGDISRIPNSTPAVAVEKAPSDPAPPAGRKRAIRGGGPLGGSESVIFKTAGEPEKSTVKLTGPEIKLPTPTPDFWKKKDTTDAPNGGGSLFGFLKDDKSTPKFTGFSFGKAKEEKESPEKSDKPEKKTESSPKFTGFGGSNASTTSPANSNAFSGFGKSTETSGSLKFPSFGDKNATSSPQKSTLSFPNFGKPTEAKKENESTTKPLSFPTFGKPETKVDGESSTTKPLAFPTFGKSADTSKNGENAIKPLSFPSFGGSTESAPIFGSSTAPTLSFSAPGGGLFGNLVKQANENAAAAEGAADEDAEYVPPKVETVETEEPDSVFSSKVAVFKYVSPEYIKMGVGMLHIKDADGKPSVLIRAATATGTVWLNALCNAAMKASKSEEKKIRLTCPVTSTEMSTFAIRFSTDELATQCTDKINEFASKK